MQQRQLGLGRAQARLGLLPLRQLQCQRRRMGPQQHLGEVVQQRGLVDQRRVVVTPVHREAQREARRPVGPAQHLAQAGQRLGLIGQALFDRGLRAEMAEERRDAQHHQRLGGGLGVRLVAALAQRRHMAQQLQGHQRVGVHALGQQVGVGGVLVGAPVFQRVGGAGQHREVPLVEGGHPGGGVAQRRLDEGGRRTRGAGGGRFGGDHGAPRAGLRPWLSAARGRP